MKKKSQYSDTAANTLMGQHFLTSQKITEDMVTASFVTKKDVIVEVGPGKGILTHELAKHAKKVIAIEKDPRFIQPLKEMFKENKNIEIIEGDILDTHITKKLPKKYKLVANIPYYLTSRLLRIFLESAQKPQSITVMIQREVAERILAHPPQMNLLALSVLAYGTPRIVQKVSRSHFKPQPDVDSAIITITNISDSFFKKNTISEKIFFEITKKAFSKKRKMLRNSISVDSQKRPQELSLNDWINIIIEFIR
ncbi:MAG: 16S rRNA (adenine(1518)-N(6)/adenine(1519)-N(6))-dimethyltransferase RsmA [Patescibacteria group bacterium]